MRLRVDIATPPPGRVSAARAEQKVGTDATCSITSLAITGEEGAGGRVQAEGVAKGGHVEG